MIEQVEAIALCLDRNYPFAALILLYVSIDTLGWIAAEREDAPVGKRFVAWIERYMLPDAGLPCNGVDLYAARCGLLHRLSWESDLSVAGRARELYFVWGNRPLGVLADFLAERNDRAIAMRIEDLLRAFHVGIRRFVEDLQRDPPRAAVAAERSAKIFDNLTTPP